MTRNKELEAVLEPKEGEEVVLYEVLDKDIKPPFAKTRSHRKDSQSDQCDEVSPVIVNDLISAHFQISAFYLINAPSTLLTLGLACTRLSDSIVRTCPVSSQPPRVFRISFY